jgi:hypothetical protein
VVRDDEEYVVGGRPREEERSTDRPLLQVEGAVTRSEQRLRNLPVGQVRGVERFEGGVLPCMHLLQWLAIAETIGSPQDRVTIDERLEGVPQG